MIPLFVLEYVIGEDYDYLNNELNLDWNEYFGFPINIKAPLYDGWEKLVPILDKYIEEHGVQQIQTETTYTDLEKGYETIDVIFKFDNKFYKFEYTSSPYVGFFDKRFLEIKEVFPHKVEIIKYY